VNAVQRAQMIMVDRVEGRIACEVTGSGPLVVLVPGMGDLRASYRLLAPELVAAGYRVASTDLRGHGDSDVTFSSYGDGETASDIVAVIEALGGGPAVVVGNSMGAAAAAMVAAQRPELVRGLAMLGPVVRDHPITFLTRLLMRVALVPLWVAPVWKAFLPSLYVGRRPADFDDYLRSVSAAMKRPGYATAFVKTARLSHAEAEAVLGDVHAPTLILMGDQDPDAPVPAEEAAWLAGRIGGDVVVVPECGHYAQSQRPDVVVPALTGFLARVAPIA
jgi:pimeloyl-ACP methyl ester carboxylesterase